MNMRIQPRAAGIGATRIVHQGFEPRRGISQPTKTRILSGWTAIAKVEKSSHPCPPMSERTPLARSALESPRQKGGRRWPWWWWRWWRQSQRRTTGRWWEGSAGSWSLWGRWRWGRFRWTAGSSWKRHWASSGNLRTIMICMFLPEKNSSGMIFFWRILFIVDSTNNDRFCLECMSRQNGNFSPMVWCPRATIWEPSRRWSVALQLCSKSLAGNLLCGKILICLDCKIVDNMISYMPSVEVQGWQRLLFSRPRTLKASVCLSDPIVTTVLLHQSAGAFDQSLARKSQIKSKSPYMRSV